MGTAEFANQRDLLLLVCDTTSAATRAMRGSWVATFDPRSGALVKTEVAIRAPWLEPGSGVSRATTTWREAPFTDESGIRVEIEQQYQQAWIKGPDFAWYLYGDPKNMQFAVSPDLIVVRTLESGKYWYDMSLLPVGQ